MTETPPTTRPRKAWLKWALIASLGINLIVVGFLVGAVLRGHPGRDTTLSIWGLRRVIHKLPEEDQAKIKASFKDIRSEMRAQSGDLRALRASVADALVAEPMDAARLTAAMDQLRGAREKISVLGQTRLIETLADLDLEARVRLAEALRKRGRRTRD